MMQLLRTWRRSPILLGLLLLSFAGLAYLIFALVVQAYFPSDGVLLTELSPSGVYVSDVLAPSPDGLQVGDQVIEVEGYSIDKWVEQGLGGGRPPERRVGEDQTYEVLRDGERIEVSVTLLPFPLGRLLLSHMGIFVSALVGLLIGGYVLFTRPQDPLARLFFLAATSLLFISALPFQTTVLVTPFLLILESGIEFLFEALTFSAILHLFLVFPVVKPLFRGRRRWLNGIHLVNPVLSLVVGLTVGEAMVDWFLLALLCRYWIGLMMLTASFFSVIHAYFTVRQPLARSQVRWVAWGSIVSLLPFLLLTGLPEIIRGEPILSLKITSFFFIALPVTVAVAVARYRLFDIDVLIHRSLLYALFAGALTGVYILLVMVIGPFILKLTGQTDDTAVVFVGALVVSMAFWAMRRRVAQLVNRLFYRTRVEAHVLLSEFSERISSTIRLEEITRLLTQMVPRRMGARQGSLMVVNEKETHLEPMGDDLPPLPVDGVLDKWSEHGGEPITCCMPPTWFPPDRMGSLEDQGAELLLPLLAGDQIVGLWIVGPHVSGRLYTTEEMQTLSTLARQAAVALQNARLVRRLEAYSQQLEEEVRERTRTLEGERNRLNVILQNMADGLLVTNTTGRVLLVNPAFEEMVRRPSRVLLGQQLDQALALPDLASLVREASNLPGRIYSRDMNLGDRVLKVTVTGLREGSMVISVLRDITHEVEVDRIKTEFISTVSHELRTPLTSVVGFTKLIYQTFDRTIAPHLPEEEAAQRAADQVRKNLEIIISEGNRLTRLINDVLDIAKMEAGKAEWKDRRCDVRQLINQAIKTVEGVAREKGLPIHRQIPADLPVLEADPDRIVQVLVNLLSNAVKFTPTGEIRVSAHALPPGEEVHGWRAPEDWGGILIAVQDTGIGIAEENLPRLFQRFQQLAGNTLTNRPKGTGLGLAICRDIVNHYNGTIWAESSPGLGSTFFFTLPAARESIDETEREMSSTSDC